MHYFAEEIITLERCKAVKLKISSFFYLSGFLCSWLFKFQLYGQSCPSSFLGFSLARHDFNDFNDFGLKD